MAERFYKYKLHLALLVLLIFNYVSASCFIAAYAKENSNYIYDLTINGESSIMGLGDSMPFFSWKMKSSDIGAKQKSYRIIVYKTDDLLTVWDSGVVESDESAGIQYGGSPLEECTSYNWKVVISDQDDNSFEAVGDGFETAFFGSGLGEAKWIKSKKSAQNDNNVVMFRKEVDLGEKHVRKARIYASSLGVYDVFINGKRVGIKESSGNTVYDELKPGWTEYNERVMYYTYDITDYLSDGENVILSEVAPGWFSGRISTMRSIGGTYGSKDVSFICRIDIDYIDETSETIVTDESWKTSFDGYYISADIYDGEVYDASLKTDFSSVEYNDTLWDAAITSTDCKGILIAKEGPSVRIKESLERTPQSYKLYEGTIDNGTTFGEINVISCPATSESVEIKKDQILQIDFGQNMVGWPSFNVKGDEGTVIQIKFAEMLNDTGESERANDGPKGKIYRDNYRTAKASLEYILAGDEKGESYSSRFAFYGFRYAEIEATEDITLIGITGQVITSIDKMTGHIETSNNEVNKLFDDIIWGQYGNYISVATDCPQRDERYGWTGDTQVFVNTAAYNSDINSFYLKWLGDANDNINKYGAYQATIPTEGVKGVNSGWSDAGIIVPYNLYKMYGNPKYLRDNYSGMKKYISYLGENGSSYRKTEYGDWFAYDTTPIDYINLVYYSYVTRLMANIAKELGKLDDIKMYSDLSDNAVKQFQNNYVKKNGDLNINTQCAYLMALHYDLLPNEESKKVCTTQLRKKIIDNDYKLTTGFLGTAILEQSLTENGLSDLSYDLLLQTDNPSWLYQVRNGATTIWERWDSYTSENGFGSKGMNSFNHYAYGCVGEWMYAYMAGIRPDEKSYGFKHFILEPTIDGRVLKEIPNGQSKITKVDVSYDSMYGLIKSSWNTGIEGSVLHYEAAVPANTDATIRLKLPKNIKKLELNGAEISAGLKSSENGAQISTGIYYVSCTETDNYDIYEFKALAGNYLFDFKGNTRYEIEVDKELLKDIKDVEEPTTEKKTEEDNKKAEKQDSTTEAKDAKDSQTATTETTESVVKKNEQKQDASVLIVKATSIKKLVKGKKCFTVKWKKMSGVTGYQIQYSTKNSFKSKKTITIKGGNKSSKKIKKLKAKKKYYVRIRTYKFVDGKKKYSQWSKIKLVKTK